MGGKDARRGTREEVGKVSTYLDNLWQSFLLNLAWLPMSVTYDIVNMYHSNRQLTSWTAVHGAVHVVRENKEVKQHYYAISSQKLSHTSYVLSSSLVYCIFGLPATYGCYCNLLWRYIYLQFKPPPNHERTPRLRRMRGTLEITIPPYVECSYLLASDTPTKWLATQWQARS